MTTEVSKTCPDCAPDRLVVRRNGETGVDFFGVRELACVPVYGAAAAGYAVAAGGRCPAAGVLMSTPDKRPLIDHKGGGMGVSAQRINMRTPDKYRMCITVQ